MVTIVDPSGNCSAARSASGSSHIWVYTSRRNQNAKSLSQTVASSCPLLLRTASAISCVFIHPPNQQSDDAIARALQFCDSGRKRRRPNTRYFAAIRGTAPACHTPVARTSEGKERHTRLRGAWMRAYPSEIGADTSWRVEATDRMNRMYRRQRHIYDGTRRYYLLGRDRMIARLQPAAGASVLEIGCGTGRNVVHAAGLYPDARFFGIDVSTEMLTSAISAISRRGLSNRIRVAHGDGTAFDPQSLFGIQAFDHVLISYSLSMIPDWRRVLQAAARHLKPGGRLHIGDFGDQERLPLI